MLKLTETQKNQTYEISLESNGIVVGSFVKIDGFFYYYPPKEKFWGVYSEEFLKSLSNELEKLIVLDINESKNASLMKSK